MRATITLGTAMAVPLRVIAGTSLPSLVMHFTPSRRAWLSPQLELDVNSPQLPRPGIQASQSYFFIAAAPRSVVGILIILACKPNSLIIEVWNFLKSSSSWEAALADVVK